MTLGEYIKNYRKEHKLSVRALSDKCGVSRSYISVLENDKVLSNTGKNAVPSLATLRKLSSGMGVDVLYLQSLLPSTPAEETSGAPVSRNILELCRRAGLSLADLSKETGVSPDVLSAIANGDGSPGYSDLEKIAQRFSLSVNELISDHPLPDRRVDPAYLQAVMEYFRSGNSIFSVFDEDGVPRFNDYDLVQLYQIEMRMKK